jgi:hypothetical protein
MDKTNPYFQKQMYIQTTFDLKNEVLKRSQRIRKAIRRLRLLYKNCGRERQWTARENFRVWYW